jgi:hypothetical protein
MTIIQTLSRILTGKTSDLDLSRTQRSRLLKQETDVNVNLNQAPDQNEARQDGSDAPMQLQQDLGVVSERSFSPTSKEDFYEHSIAPESGLKRH